ncbi:MAG TPA: ATP synthase F1 subunit gamma [Candidatus Saccharimonadales bacterium]|nr:ATP synthase F1 subunit gamma [Candidatus Saccharimonadales bacterium]
MSSTQQIRRRINSVRSTKQITKAMEMAAASKLRHAQEAVEKPRAFSLAARELLTELRRLNGASDFGWFKERPIKSRLLVPITSDRVLAGAYNGNVIRTYLKELHSDAGAHVENMTICIGRQVALHATRLKETEIIGLYDQMPDALTANDIRPIINTVINAFLEKEVDAVDLIYTEYHSTLSQQVVIHRILPAGFEQVPVSQSIATAEFEPSVDELLDSAVLRLIEVQLYQAMLDAAASEHSMRMLAMKNATDNASALVDDLTLAYNNARQATITQELAEITGGAEAMKDD